MQKDLLHHRWTIAEVSLSIFVLSILLFFTYGIFVRAAYVGFRYDPTNGNILGNYVGGDHAPTLKDGDILVKVGHISWQEYEADNRLDIFEDVKQGDVVNIIVNRGNNELTIPWDIPGFNQQEFYNRFFNIWWLAYVYWLFGTATLLFMRPRDMIRRLLIAANYLTSLFLIFGSLSAWHLWESSILLHAVTWLILPVYIHLHWIFPKPLYQTLKWVTPLLYFLCLLFAIGELIQILPRRTYAFAFLFALIGSAGLQSIHFIRRPEQRREISFLAIAILLVIAPLVSLLISGVSSKIAFLTFLAMPFIPLSYFYVVYRRQMGGLELRANRLVSAYAFLIILGAGLLLLLGPAELLQISREAAIFLMLMVTLLTVFISIMVFPSFQAFVEQRFLGIKLPYQNLQETYSSRIAASASMPGLLLLLDEEIFPSLFVRQFAFMQVLNGSLKVLFARNVSGDQLPRENGLTDLLTQEMRYRLEGPPARDSIPTWVRLILPLKVGDSLIGFWLLGRRDPDDLYSPAEIPILQSIANQTAIALSNILHADQLRKIYQSDIERYEQERLSLALDLHDSILNQLAVLRNNLEERNVSPKFQTAYEELTRRVREIVSELRPPMLMYGLKPAIEELAQNLMERCNDKIRIKADLEASEERIPAQMELHLYRIVQEACENSLRYANPKTISIYGSLTSGKVDLNIHDDGEGFETNSKLELDNLRANRHFGLAGMIERAYLIDSKIKIHSSLSTGTRIHITWVFNSEEN